MGKMNWVEIENIKKRDKERVRKNYDAMFAQVEEFLRLYKKEDCQNSDTAFAYNILKAFANMKNKNRISKIFDILRYSFFKSSLILTIGEMLNI